MKKIKFIIFAVSCLLTAVLSGCLPLAPSPERTVLNRTNPDFLKNAGIDETTDPHKDRVCKACHLAGEELLVKENPTITETAQRKLMGTDLIDVCLKCHKTSLGFEHVVGIGTILNKENLPLDHQKNITCATTCHDIHTKDPNLSKGLLRHPFDTLCLSCHDV